ncbi:glutathione binding-like protein [Chelatococcus reniformis]|uniref:Glutathione S-transferase n=1 Tax=Chelatococcus reniformis TaxID=1494448 RepID=A0A916X850_9HYPH|nr:glutathione binding-like protein [Chelatococcus reniformis]GGC49614.1 glutathione S-transferase [Chelatococcus reniformis]
MELFYSPLACSLASRIALYEAGAQPTFTAVDLEAKRTRTGEDYLAINPMGQVPAIRTDSGETLTENPVVLQYVADRHPDAHLAPTDPVGRARLQQWLSFVGTELHKLVFSPLLDPAAPEDAKRYARAKAGPRFAVLDRHLAGRDYLLDRFSVADAYLAAILNWASFVKIDFDEWPALKAYRDRLMARPAVAKALAEEYEQYKAA